MSLSCHTAFFLMRTPVMLDDIILTNYLCNSPIPNKVMLRLRVVTTLTYELGDKSQPLATSYTPFRLLLMFVERSLSGSDKHLVILTLKREVNT